MNPRAPSGGAWAAGRDSFVYRARYGEDDGLNLIALRALSGGRGEISVIGSGVDVDVPELPLDQAAGVELQLQNRDGRCWGAKFPDALRSTAVLHQAVED